MSLGRMAIRKPRKNVEQFRATAFLRDLPIAGASARTKDNWLLGLEDFDRHVTSSVILCRSTLSPRWRSWQRPGVAQVLVKSKTERNTADGGRPIPQRLRRHDQERIGRAPGSRPWMAEKRSIWSSSAADQCGRYSRL